MQSTRELDLAKLNSATKYPSIPTYHALGEKGALLDETVDFDGQPLIATEKVDGINSRIILMPDGCYLIGSREELLHARGDLIHNPALGIVETLKQTAERMVELVSTPADTITVVYLETYGEHRVQRGLRVLKNHADLVPPDLDQVCLGLGRQILSLEHNTAVHNPTRRVYQT